MNPGVLMHCAGPRGKLRAVAFLSLVLLAFSLLLVPALARADEQHAPASGAADDFSEKVPGATEIEGRIIAPCCWNQTIDIHGSEPATALRREIRARLKAGESKEAIEASLVERYGQKILAVPAGSRLGGAGVLLAIFMGVAGVGAVSLLRRWQRRSSAHPGGGAAQAARGPRDALDDRLDAELARLDSD